MPPKVVPLKDLPTWKTDGPEYFRTHPLPLKPPFFSSNDAINDKVSFWMRGDSARLAADAIVNAANSGLHPGGGICGVIHSAAGPQLAQACAKIGKTPTGQAALTPGFKLPAKYVIHAVGPVWRGGKSGEREKLIGAYESSLDLALSHDCESVAFPLISSGIYGYPKDLALHEAMTTIGGFLLRNREICVYLSVYPERIGLTKDLKDELSRFLKDGGKSSFFSERTPPDKTNPSPNFKEALLNLMRVKNYSEEELSKRANLKSETVKAILNEERALSPSPSKRTVISLSLGLGLSPLETNAFLTLCGHEPDPKDKTDLITVFFLEKNITDAFLVSEALYAFGEPQLNAGP
jgi:O-acetyl-ADP-ribose deacetylase (regulator of RNase III)/transcriptional regulator with XRE-family HTH domain